jgi:hypothetical protein
MKGERFIIINIHLPILTHVDILLVVTIMAAIAETVGWLRTGLTHTTAVGGPFVAITAHFPCKLSVKTWGARRRVNRGERRGVHDVGNGSGRRDGSSRRNCWLSINSSY